MVGADLHAVDETDESLKEFGNRYIRRLFTSYEIEDCNRNRAANAGRYAERFAAKEAVLKVLDCRGLVPSWKDIEVRRESGGRFRVVLYDIAAEIALRRGIREISLDISHANGFAIAVALARF
jgi:holo-[acyl-carrier protein] synthase